MGEEIYRHARICAVVSFICYTTQFLGGFYANSMAVMIDSTRFFGDAVGYAVRMVRLREEMKGTSDKFPFGSAQVFHALTFLGMGLWCIQNLLLLMEGLERFFVPRTVYGGTMVFFAITRLLNDYAIVRLSMQYHIPRFAPQRFGSLGEAESDTTEAGADGDPNEPTTYSGGGEPLRPGRMPNRRWSRTRELGLVAKSYITSRGSFLFIFSFLIWTQPINLGVVGDDKVPFWDYLDGYCCFYVFILSVTPVRDTIRVSFDALMLRRPPGIFVRDVHAQLLSIPNIVTVGKLHVFSAGIVHTILAAHIVIDNEANGPEVLRRAKKAASQLGFTRATFELTRTDSSARFHTSSNFAPSAIYEDDAEQYKAMQAAKNSDSPKRSKAPSPHPRKTPAVKFTGHGRSNIEMSPLVSLTADPNDPYSSGPAPLSPHPRRTPAVKFAGVGQPNIEMSPLVSLTADPNDPYSSGPAPPLESSYSPPRGLTMDSLQTGESFGFDDIADMVPPVPPAIAAAMAANNMFNDAPPIRTSPRFEHDDDDEERHRGMPCAPGRRKKKGLPH